MFKKLSKSGELKGWAPNTKLLVIPRTNKLRISPNKVRHLIPYFKCIFIVHDLSPSYVKVYFTGRFMLTSLNNRK